MGTAKIAKQSKPKGKGPLGFTYTFSFVCLFVFDAWIKSRVLRILAY